jgi:hypothetical protein
MKLEWLLILNPLNSEYSIELGPEQGRACSPLYSFLVLSRSLCSSANLFMKILYRLLGGGVVLVCPRLTAKWCQMPNPLISSLLSFGLQKNTLTHAWTGFSRLAAVPF